jgi:hypothetical protein
MADSAADITRKEWGIPLPNIFGCVSFVKDNRSTIGKLDLCGLL